jgi:hypothetical protein
VFQGAMVCQRSSHAVGSERWTIWKEEKRFGSIRSTLVALSVV